MPSFLRLFMGHDATGGRKHQETEVLPGEVLLLPVFHLFQLHGEPGGDCTAAVDPSG